MTRTKLLIDCDPGHDDALAILYAAKHLELIGLTTVHGNNSVENTTRNALAVLALGNIDMPVAMGCADPLAQTRHPNAAVHGASGLDGAELPAPRQEPLDTHAIDFLIDMASKHREELVLAVIGPQTNVALALRREPKMRKWIREITIMGGSTERGNITPAAEFNIHCDPEAAWTVMNSGVPFRMVGLNITRRTGLHDADLARLRGDNRQVAQAAAGLMSFYLARQRERRDTRIAPVHDVCAIVPFVDPNLIGYVEANIEIELAGTHTRGMTVCDLDRPVATLADCSDGPLAAQVAVDVKSRELIEHLIDTLLTYE